MTLKLTRINASLEWQAECQIYKLQEQLALKMIRKEFGVILIVYGYIDVTTNGLRTTAITKYCFIGP